MKRLFGARIALTVCVTIGLMVAPLSVPSMANSTDMQMSSSEMSGDMPCCPDAVDQKMPQDGGCKDCPLMAVCSVTSLPAVPAAGLADFKPVLLAVISAADDPFADGLIDTPPTRPPRSLV